MSVYRTLTRVAVVSALNNYMATPWPTLAGPNIFDSKIEPVEDMAKDRALPCCVVYTDYDKDHWMKGQKAHDDRLLTVTLELLIVQAAQDASPDGTYKLDCPYTDSEIETSLDIFEAQILRALSAPNVAAEAFNYLCPGCVSVVSRRGATVEGGIRLAARQITLEMKAVREPAAGTIPMPVEKFLQQLEQNDDYKDRADEFRAILTAPSSDTANERALRIFGYSRDLGHRLGAPSGAPVFLPPNITYILNGATP